MKKIYFVQTLCLILFISTESKSQCNVNLLTDPGFDVTSQSLIGNNLTGLTTLNGWTMTGGPFNVIKTDGSAYGGGPDNAKNGNQYVDITSAAGTIYQDFSITGGPKQIGFSGYFSSREQGPYTNWTASIDIVNTTTSAVVATSNTRLFTNADGASPAQENWYLIFGNATLPSGNYRYVVNLGDFGNFDAAQVSENCVLASSAQLTGSLQNGKAFLNWNVTSTNQIAKYEIEQSLDGTRFNTIGSLNASNNTSNNFSSELLSANSFFRIKIKNVDGSSTFTNSVYLTVKNISFTTFPNPVTDYVLVAGLSNKGYIKVLDVAGKILITKNVEKNTQSFSIDVSSLSKGSYFIQYFDGVNYETKKIVKQ